MTARTTAAPPTAPDTAPTAAPVVTAGEFRQAMGRFLTGVTVVTAYGPEGPYGTTVSSLASVSLDPPMLLICLGHRSRTARVIGERGLFTVNVLGRDQSALAARFAAPDRPRGHAGFAAVPHRLGPAGTPVLDGTLAHLDCRVTQRVVAGDHTVVIGEVTGTGCADGAGPLAHHRGKLLTPW
ncbi:flavin reductase family protein [Streptomyces pactum]|uniref:Flavin reductase family protein n=1 Tax=Streptomyces pactum TaxID=68249 RepID=A0ABS0NT74_9ACTN|nr:flavin reductase family protein [Streptomyces pactum]MBH5338407.1 flavin reductase family protein [Streptomyces pactum]